MSTSRKYFALKCVFSLKRLKLSAGSWKSVWQRNSGRRARPQHQNTEEQNFLETKREQEPRVPLTAYVYT